MLYSTFLLLSLILECAWARMDENEFIWCVVVYLFCRKTCVRPAFSSYYLEFGSLWSEMLIMRRDFDFSNAKLRLFQCYYMFLLLLGNVSSTTNISYILFILTANNLFLGFFNWFYYYLVMTFDMFLFFLLMQFNLFCEDFDQVFSTFKVSAGMPLLCRCSFSHAFCWSLKCVHQ